MSGALPPPGTLTERQMRCGNAHCRSTAVDNDRKRKNLIAELEALSLDAITQAEGWIHQTVDRT